MIRIAHLSARLLDAIAAETAVFHNDASDEAACDGAARAAHEAGVAVLKLDPATVHISGHIGEYRVALAAVLRRVAIMEGWYSSTDFDDLLLTRLADATLAGSTFDRPDLWLWHVNGDYVPDRPATQFPVAA